MTNIDLYNIINIPLNLESYDLIKILDEFKQSNFTFILLSNISIRIFSKNLNYGITKHTINIWFDFIDEIEILKDEINMIYKSENNEILKFLFDNDTYIIIEKN